LRSAGCDVADFGADQWTAEDYYPDYIIPLAKAIASGEVESGSAL
jgi:ribose 5-phosphate isomerase B